MIDIEGIAGKGFLAKTRQSMVRQPDLFGVPQPETKPDPPPHRTQEASTPNRYTKAKRSDLLIYLDWLREVDVLISRHASGANDAWQQPPDIPSLAVELRGIAEFMEEFAEDIRQIADGLEHLDHDANRMLGDIDA